MLLGWSYKKVGLVGHVEFVAEIKHSYIILVKYPNGKFCLDDISVTHKK